MCVQWVCVYMGMYCSGYVCTVGMCVHGYVCTWVCVYSGYVCTWVCVYYYSNRSTYVTHRSSQRLVSNCCSTGRNAIRWPLLEETANTVDFYTLEKYQGPLFPEFPLASSPLFWASDSTAAYNQSYSAQPPTVGVRLGTTHTHKQKINVLNYLNEVLLMSW